MYICNQSFIYLFMCSLSFVYSIYHIISSILGRVTSGVGLFRGHRGSYQYTSYILLVLI